MTPAPSPPSWRSYAVTSAMTATAAIAGARGTSPGSAWYRRLDKPRWQPPPIAFPLVWTPLYAAIAWATGRGLARSRGRDRRRLATLTALDLTANAGWCWAFFDRRSPRGGLAVITALDALNLTLVRSVGRRDRAAAAALTPYVAWTGFATALNLAIWRRNR